MCGNSGASSGQPPGQLHRRGMDHTKQRDMGDSLKLLRMAASNRGADVRGCCTTRLETPSRYSWPCMSTSMQPRASRMRKGTCSAICVNACQTCRDPMLPTRQIRSTHRTLPTRQGRSQHHLSAVPHNRQSRKPPSPSSARKTSRAAVAGGKQADRLMLVAVDVTVPSRGASAKAAQGMSVTRLRSR